MLPYSETLIRHGLNDITNKALQRIIIMNTVDSTNTLLLKEAREGERRTCALLAHEQSAGRGRQGKRWYSPIHGALYLSLLWHFESSPFTPLGLSLVVGISLCETLKHWEIDSLGLKWPNDLLWHQKKLGGILVEAYMDSQGITHGVIGIGINIHLPQNSYKHIQQPWIDLNSIRGKNIDNNGLASTVLNNLVDSLTLFEEEGLAPFQESWDHYDILRNRAVRLTGLPKKCTGIAKGIDDKGGLKVATKEGVSVHYSGEVSVGLA